MYWVFSAPKVLGDRQFKNVQGNNKKCKRNSGNITSGLTVVIFHEEIYLLTTVSYQSTLYINTCSYIYKQYLGILHLDLQ